MTDFAKALAAAREALADADFNDFGVKVTYASALADLLAALDAQQAPPAPAVKNREPNRIGLASQCYDSAQLSTLPSWCRELLESAADALCEVPPAAVVPAPMKYSTLDDVRGGKFYADSHVDGWNACRAAMLAATNKENTND